MSISLPEPHAIKVVEIDSRSVYVRWSILSNHGLTKQQLTSLRFEFRTQDNKLRADCVEDEPITDYKARLLGLCDDTKYRFQVRSKLIQDNGKTLYSKWSSRISVTTRPVVEAFIVITNAEELERQSLIHTLEAQIKENQRLKLQIEQLKIKMNEHAVFKPGHWSWDSRKILHWMLRLQGGKYLPYEEVLTKVITEEDLTGKDLVDITEDDLRSWGVTRFADRKALFRQIQDLTAKDKEVEDAEDMEDDAPLMVDELSSLADAAFKPATAVTDPVQDKETEEDLQDVDPEETKAEETIEVQREATESKDDCAEAPKKSDDAKEETEKDIGMISRTFELSRSVTDILAKSAIKTWNYKDGMLTVAVVKATNVPNMDKRDKSGASDPYVVLHLKGNLKPEQTKYQWDEPNPSWNERFQLLVDDAKNDALRVELWDHNTFMPDAKIGELAIPVITVLGANGYVKKDFAIPGTDGCTVTMELKYWEPRMFS